MKKKYLMNGMALLALGLTMGSCSKETGFTEKDAVSHAEKELGVTINSNTDWKMTQEVKANVSVNLGLDQQYTVAVYDVNPLFNEDATYYAKKEVNEGGTVSLSMDLPQASNTYYVAVFDSKFRGVVEAVQVEDGNIVVDFGGSVTTRSAFHRATEAEYADSYAKTMSDFLNPGTEILNQVKSYSNLDFKVSTISLDDMSDYTPITDDLIVNQTSNGNHTLSDRSWSAGLDGKFPGNSDGKHYRVARGVEITEIFHINGEYGKWNDAVIYIEGKVHLKGNTLNGPTLVVGSTGEIVIDSDTNMSNAGRIILMAGAKITGTSGAKFNVNNGAPCYNAGTIDFNGELNINGSVFYNCGTVNVDVLRNTSGGLITNFGSITARTNMGAADAYNCTFVNGCYMHYTEQAGIGHLTMLKNSRLDVDGFCEFNQSWTAGFDASTPANALAYVPANPNILMDKSVVNVGTAYVTNTVFQGPSTAGEIAIVKMGKVQVGNGTDLMQRQNCYFDWNITELYHNWNKNVTDANSKYQDISAADKVYNPYGYLVDYYRGHVTKFITEATSPVTIPAGTCTGTGYNPGGGGGGKIPGGPAIYSYAFEDSYNGDYDMNDVVLKVQENPNDATKLDFYLMCTGASYDLYVYLTVGGMTYPLFNGPEVHAAMGGTAHMFINTGTPDGKKFDQSQPAAWYSMDKPAGIGNNLATLDVWIQSPQGDIHVATEGQDPHGVVIPSNWRWPKEYQSIKLAYPNFVGFADSSTRGSYLDWYNYPNENLIYK